MIILNILIKIYQLIDKIKLFKVQNLTVLKYIHSHTTISAISLRVQLTLLLIYGLKISSVFIEHADTSFFLSLFPKQYNVTTICIIFILYKVIFR